MKNRRPTCRIALIAVGLLVVSREVPAQTDPVIRALADSVSSVRMLETVRTLERAGGTGSRMNFTPGNDSARILLLRTLASLPRVTAGSDTFFVPAEVPYDARPLFNVFARLPGSVDSSTAVVIGAHYDSQAGRDTAVWSTGWYTARAPGADDNASGVAGVLEVARLLTTSGYANRLRVYFVAFGAEEGTTPGIASYLNGSRHFAQRLRADGVNVVAFINLDMIAYNPLALVGTIVADSQSQELGQRVAALNAAYDCGLSLNAAPYPANRWSDHASFWDQGYPAVLLIEHFDVVKADSVYPGNPNYHHASDTSGALNPSLLEAFCRLALVSVAEISERGVAVTAVQGREVRPEDFTLAAYPNPFNPAVTLELSLGRASEVRVDIFDVLGRRVDTLVQGLLEAGRHRLKWTAAGRASGFYLAKVSAETGIRSVRLLLLR